MYKITSDKYNYVNSNDYDGWYDEDTNLLWEIKTSENIERTYNPKEILEYAKKLNRENYGGYNDWRVPTLDELKTLLTDEKYNGFYIKKPLSKNIYSYWHYSSSNNDNKNYCIHFGNKSINYYNDNNFIRCVRTGIRTNSKINNISTKQKLFFNPNEWNSYSKIDDFNNLVIFIDRALDTIDREIVKNSKILQNSNRAYIDLKRLKVEDKNLQEIKTYLLSKFDFSLDNLKDKIILIKSEALDYLDRVESSLSIDEDVELSKKEIDFNFTASKIVRLYEIQIEKINNSSNIDKFFNRLLKEIKLLHKREEKFSKIDRDNLKNIFIDSDLESRWEDIYHEWSIENNKINQIYLKFIKAYFIGKISENMVINIFEILNQIKDNLEEFYTQIRLGTIIKYKDSPKSKLLEEIDTKSRIFKIYNQSQSKLLGVLKDEKSQVSYRFLNTILSELLDFEMDIKSDDYQDIYQQMADLHSQNLEIYLSDIEIYAKELEKRNLDILNLMFKMENDLKKRG